ncbi:MAG: SRPBCC family protein [Gemmatimonadota bacterium]
MPATSTDRIEKQIVLEAPRSRVWRALTDVRQFNQWFGVNLEGPFKAGEKTSGRITIPNYDHIVMEAWVEKVEPEHHFSFRWHPGSVDPSVDYSKEPTTLVVFTLEDDEEGTKLTVVETGFDALPESRRAKAFAGNESGWAGQLRNIAKYLKENS